MTGRPKGRAGNGARRTFAQISEETGIPWSTVYGAYRRAEEKFVIAFLARQIWERDKLTVA